MAQTGDDYLYCIGIKMVNPDFVCFPKWADVVTTFEHILKTKAKTTSITCTLVNLWTLTSNYNFLPIDVFTKPLQCFGKSVHVEGSMVVATSRLFYLLEEN